MTKPDYREPLAPAPQKPFAIQAAQFAFWAPLLGLLVGFLLTSGLRQTNPAVGTLIGWTTLLLNAAALILDATALLSMRKHGTRGILLRSIIGILISGSILSLSLYIAFGPKPADRVTQRLIGEWDSSATTNGKTLKSHLSLQPAGIASMRLTMDDASLTAHGKWKLLWDKNAPPLIVIAWNPDTDPRLGAGLNWIIDQLNDTHIAMHSLLPETHVSFTRQPK